jgi:hypothetical protein
MSDDEETALAKAGEAKDSALLTRPWSGDEHKLQVEAASEAGLEANEVELELFTEGFKAGMVLQDRADKAIVLQGRTILARGELKKALTPLTRFLQVPMSEVGVQVHDGKFELRVSNTAAERAAPALDSAKVALKTFFGFGLMGLLAMQLFKPLAAIVWGVGLLLGGYALREGLVNGRSMLAGHFVLGLGMLAQEEGLILPPAEADAAKVGD